MYLFLVNPAAGNRQFQKIEKHMKRMLEKLEIKHRFVMINDLLDIPKLIEKNLRPSDQAVIVVGGNATVNNVINTLADQDVALGVVPMSRTNYLARSLGIKNWQQAVRLLKQPELKNSRLGKIGQHYFIGNVRVASRQNLLTTYFNRTSLWRKFLGLAHSTKTLNEGVTTQMIVDNEIKATGEAKSLDIILNGEHNEKRLKIQLIVGDAPSSDSTLLHGNNLKIESDRKMPVIMGNETVAHTPIEIVGLSKYIKLIIPKKEEKLTAKASS